MTLLTTAFSRGTHAARPAAAASNNGFYYFETDTGNLFQSSGAAWVQVATTSSGSSGSEIGYDQITTGVTPITGTTEGTATTVITCGAHVFDGAAAIATFYTPLLRSDTSSVGDSIVVGLFESGTLVNRFYQQFTAVTGTGTGASAMGAFRFTPSAASHSYVVAAWATGSTNTQVAAGTGGAGNNPPCWVRFTKV